MQPSKATLVHYDYGYEPLSLGRNAVSWSTESSVFSSTIPNVSACSLFQHTNGAQTGLGFGYCTLNGRMI
jgi:hypothetical protein